MTPETTESGQSVRTMNRSAKRTARVALEKISRALDELELVFGYGSDDVEAIRSAYFRLQDFLAEVPSHIHEPVLIAASERAAGSRDYIESWACFHCGVLMEKPEDEAVE